MDLKRRQADQARCLRLGERRSDRANGSKSGAVSFDLLEAEPSRAAL
jgi:hypothetical protein